MLSGPNHKSMYDDIVEVAQNRQFLDAVRYGYGNGPNLNLLRHLPAYDDLKEHESKMETEHELEFNAVFHKPLGNYLIKCFLTSDYSVDKAIFVSDVEMYKNLHHSSARQRVAPLIYEQFIANRKPDHRQGISVFDLSNNFCPFIDERKISPPQESSVASLRDVSYQRKSNTMSDSHNLELMPLQKRLSSDTGTDSLNVNVTESVHTDDRAPNACLGPLGHTHTNAVGIYGPCIDRVKEEIDRCCSRIDLFDEVLNEVLEGLRLDVFPRFINSSLCKLYIQCKSLETRGLAITDFEMLRVLGRGAFGFVNACIKKDTGNVYACKCINKKRVMATDSVETIMAERNFLADMESRFVTGLKYAMMDTETLYLIIDLMVGGDLKFHLNKEGKFDMRRSRFYAAEVALGLAHIHGKGIVYRDIKLENVLLDNKGHCKISDLGLAVRAPDSQVRGYAGTPGYTAPEVCLQMGYHQPADFFSFGVMIYRFLSGRKPFQPKRKSKPKNPDHRGGNELDKNVVELEPDYPDQYFNPASKSLLKGLMSKNPRNRLGSHGIDEVKHHPWFDPIDFGLLEAGYLDPPFQPNQDEINADSLRHIGRPPRDDQYAKQKLTAQFEESLQDFPFISKPSLQDEMVSVLQKVHSKYNFAKFANENINTFHPETILPSNEIPPMLPYQQARLMALNNPSSVVEYSNQSANTTTNLIPPSTVSVVSNTAPVSTDGTRNNAAAPNSDHSAPLGSNATSNITMAPRGAELPSLKENNNDPSNRNAEPVQCSSCISCQIL